jgi:hypothetical protein
MNVRICGVVPSAPPNGDPFFLIIILLLQAVSIHEPTMSHSLCSRQVGLRAASRYGSQQGPLWADQVDMAALTARRARRAAA